MMFDLGIAYIMESGPWLPWSGARAVHFRDGGHILYRANGEVMDLYDPEDVLQPPLVQ